MFEFDDIVCYQKQLFLKFVFVIIVYKNKDLILFKVVIFLSRKNVNFTNTYVVLLKIQNYNDFAIEEFFFMMFFFLNYFTENHNSIERRLFSSKFKSVN